MSRLKRTTANFAALATDGDGTLLRGGHLGKATLQALVRLREVGKKIILTTGETTADLAKFPHIRLFDMVVAENGALLYVPATGKEHVLAKHPRARLLRALQHAAIKPLKTGHVIICTQYKHEQAIAKVIAQMNAPWQIIRNRRQLMILPDGVNKGSGLAAALRKLKLKRAEVVGVGDAENDVALLQATSCGVAVANAVSRLKQCARFVTKRGAGAGIIELVNCLLGHRKHVTRNEVT